jgi:hypothetical protein
MDITKEEQAMRDNRNARCLFYDRCYRDISALRKYVESKTSYDVLVNSGMSKGAAAKIISEQFNLPDRLTFSSYQVGLAQRILDGKFPGILPRVSQAGASPRPSQNMTSHNVTRAYAPRLEEQLDLL